MCARDVDDVLGISHDLFETSVHDRHDYEIEHDLIIDQVFV